MTITELQTRVATALNGVQDLIQGGCKTFAENSRDVYTLSNQWVNAGKVAIVIVTPDMTRNGSDPDSIPAETQLVIQCSEKPQLSRAQSGVMTALDAAEMVMHSLDGSQFCWQSTRQTINAQSGVLTATVTFSTSILLS